MWIPALASVSAIFTLPSVGQNNLICSRGVANEIRKSIHGRSGLNQRVIIGSPEPRSDGVIGHEEMTRRFRFVPASHGTQFQDGHPFYGCTWGASVGGDALHPSTVDA
jgi:hypothetical protein